MLITRIHIKSHYIDQYLELAGITDIAIQSSEPGMIHHTFDGDPDNPQAFIWLEVYANDDAFTTHISNPPIQEL